MNSVKLFKISKSLHKLNSGANTRTLVRYKSDQTIFGKLGYKKSSNFKPTEIEIPVPWGKVSAQLWGNQDAPNPVLCLHGLTDNSNTFSPVMPYLSHLTNHKFICIDLPGHGQSSHLFDGQLYNPIDFIVLIKRIKNYFDWKDFTIFGHSVGGVLGFVYASTNKGDVKQLICVDAIGPFIMTKKMAMEAFPKIMTGALNLEQNREKDTTTSLTSEELLKTYLKRDFPGLTNESANLLLLRGSREVENSKFQFTHDKRIKYLPFMIWLNIKQVQIISEHLMSDVLYFRSTNGATSVSRSVLQRIKNWILSNKGRKNTFFEVGIEGNHYSIILNTPEKLAPHIVRFLATS